MINRFFAFVFVLSYCSLLYAQHPGARHGSPLYWAIIGGLAWGFFSLIYYLVKYLFRRIKKSMQNRKATTLDSSLDKKSIITNGREDCNDTCYDDYKLNENANKNKDNNDKKNIWRIIAISISSLIYISCIIPFFVFSFFYENKEEREIFGYSLFVISIFLLVIIIKLLLCRKIGKENLRARSIAFYWIICFIMSVLFILWGGIEFSNHTVEYTIVLAGWSLLLIPTSIPYLITLRFLANKSNQCYNNGFLIPDFLSSFLKTNTEFRKRMLMTFLIYPFFFVVPIPIIGAFVFVFYILPVLLIFGATRVVMWIREGKKLDSQLNVHTNKAQLYCRHCGKLIDADSDFCRYCGKKL